MIKKRAVRRIYQVLPCFSERDAIGNDTLLMHKFFQKMGIPSDIFFSESGLSGFSKPISEMFDSHMDQTLLIYHFSVASHLTHYLGSLPGPIWSRYHNITPPHFFNREAEIPIRETCRQGRLQIPFVGAISDLVVADSAYNAEEMQLYTREPIHVLPILRDYERLALQSDDENLLAKLKSIPVPILLFVGRLAPNKCQHDLIQLAYLYLKATGVRVKVVLVGSFASPDYPKSVKLFSTSLSLSIGENFESDVVVLGSVSDSEMATLYRNSQAFVSMSEHEGFGVPLVESLWFNLPVIAHNSSAIGETLGDAGFLIDKSNWVGVVETLHQVLTQGCSSELKRAMQKRRDQLSIQKTELALQNLIESYLAPLW